MSPLSIVHIGFGILSLILGGIVVTLPKGTLNHRRFGYAYVVSMVLLNGTAFGIYHLVGHFGPFHALALVSLAGLLAGILPVLKKPVTDRALIGHVRGIGWSYVGLWAATAAETAVRLPAFRVWANGAAIGTLVGTALVMFIGGGFLSRYRQRLERALQAKTQEAAVPVVPALPVSDKPIYS